MSTRFIKFKNNTDVMGGTVCFILPESQGTGKPNYISRNTQRKRDVIYIITPGNLQKVVYYYKR